MKNDFFESKDFVIDIEKKFVTIKSCKISVILKIQFKNSYVRKIVHVQQTFVL